MSLTNISFPYTIRTYCPSTTRLQTEKQQIFSFGDVEINYAPMFNPLVYQNIIPFPMNPIMPQNRFARTDRDFRFDDPSKMDLPCKQ